MPSVSPKQRRTMAAAAHDANFARKMGIPQSVAREFNQADQATGNRVTGGTHMRARTKKADHMRKQGWHKV